MICNHHLNVIGCIENILIMEPMDLVMIEQTLWLIGNLTGDNALIRDQFLIKTSLFQTFGKLVGDDQNP